MNANHTSTSLRTGPGNVLTTISDRKKRLAGTTPAFEAVIETAQDYYPFGSLMPGRKYNAGEYRFGFNGQEKDDEIAGVTGSHLDFGARVKDSRIGRFLSLDPRSTDFPFISPYCFAANSPIKLVDSNGEGPYDPTTGTRISSNWFNVSFWGYIDRTSTSNNKPFSYDPWLDQTAYALKNTHNEEGGYRDLGPDEIGYKSRNISRPYTTVLEVGNVPKVYDITNRIESSDLSSKFGSNFSALEKAASIGNYIFASEDWKGKDFNVYTVQDGWINRDARFEYDKKANNFYLKQEKVYSMKYSEMNEDTGKITVSVTETITKYDKEGNVTDSQVNEYSHEVKP